MPGVLLQALLETLAGIGWTQALAISAALVLASLLRAFTGFGFALAAVPALSLFLLPSEAVVLSAALTVVANGSSLHSYRGDYPVRQLLPLLAMSVVGTALGVLVLSGLSTLQFQLLIGPCVLLVCVVLTLYRPLPQQQPRPWRRRWGAVVGFLSGLMNGAFAIPGPPVVVFAMATERDPARSRAMLLYFFLFSALIALVIFGFAGYLSWRTLQLMVLALPAMIVGDQIGLRLFRRYGKGTYRRAALFVLYAMGISLTARGLFGIVAGGWVATA